MEVKVSWLVICQIVGFRSLVLGNCQKIVKDTLMGGARGGTVGWFLTPGFSWRAQGREVEPCLGLHAHHLVSLGLSLPRCSQPSRLSQINK